MRQLTQPLLPTTAQELLTAIAQTIWELWNGADNFHHLTGHYLLADLFKLPTTFPWLSDWLSAAWCPDNLRDRCV